MYNAIGIDAAVQRLNPPQREAVQADGRSSAHYGGGRQRQDAGAYPPDCLFNREETRCAMEHIGDYVYE